jgi:hypothetical protein
LWHNWRNQNLNWQMYPKGNGSEREMNNYRSTTTFHSSAWRHAIVAVPEGHDPSCVSHSFGKSKLALHSDSKELLNAERPSCMWHKVVPEDVSTGPSSSPSLDDILALSWGFSLLSNSVLCAYITDMRKALFRSSPFNCLITTKEFSYPVSDYTHLDWLWTYNTITFMKNGIIVYDENWICYVKYK